MKGADRLILATDPDREGEAISWHVLETLKQRKALGKAKVERVAFNAITKAAVQEAIANPARHRRRIGRCLSRPPRARLSGGLHAVARAVAQTARRALGRPRAIGGAPAGLRARDRDRGVPARRNTGPSMPIFAAAGGNFTAKLTHFDGKSSTSCRLKMSPMPNARSPRSARGAFTVGRGRTQAGQAPPLGRRSSPPPCSRRPRASSASAPRAP